MDYGERGYHARCVYPTQDTSRMGTASVKQEEEKKQTQEQYKDSSKKSGRNERGQEEEKSRARLK